MQAISHCHSKGVIHGDVKPGNIMVDIENEAVAYIVVSGNAVVKDIPLLEE